jgi:hypothetical protein
VKRFSLVKIKNSSSGENQEDAKKSSNNFPQVIKLYNTENANGSIQHTSKVAILIDKHIANHTQDHSIGDSLHGFEWIIPNCWVKMFSVSQVNTHKQNGWQVKAQIDKHKDWDIKIVADEGKERLDVTTGQNEVDTDDIECLEMWNGVDLWPKDWEEDEHDFCVVEKTDEHEL